MTTEQDDGTLRAELRGFWPKLAAVIAVLSAVGVLLAYVGMWSGLDPLYWVGLWLALPLLVVVLPICLLLLVGLFIAVMVAVVLAIFKSVRWVMSTERLDPR